MNSKKIDKSEAASGYENLDVFFLDHLEDIPPVSKYLQTSKFRAAHVVPVDREEEIKSRLINRMKTSYELVSK
jgi:hypothetical protein